VRVATADFEAEERWIDYGPLDELVETRVLGREPAALAANAHRFRGKCVLVGMADPDDARDNAFVPPGRRTPFPGVYAHACAAATFIGPALSAPTFAGRLAIDVAMTLSVFGAVLAIRSFYAKRERRELDRHRLERAIVVAVLAATVVLGVLGVRWTRLLWDDYVLACGGLLAHLYADRIADLAGRVLPWLAFSSAPRAAP
jgi:CHASE2 domain-containing sensor protein